MSLLHVYEKDLCNEPAATLETERHTKVQHQFEEISKYNNFESSNQLCITAKPSLFKASYISLFQILEDLGNIIYPEQVKDVTYILTLV